MRLDAVMVLGKELRRDPERATETSENVRELVSAVQDFERAHSNPTLLPFL